MNKVYLVSYQSTYEDHMIVGVFSTEQAAEEYINSNSMWTNKAYYDIEEWDIQ